MGTMMSRRAFAVLALNVIETAGYVHVRGYGSFIRPAFATPRMRRVPSHHHSRIQQALRASAAAADESIDSPEFCDVDPCNDGNKSENTDPEYIPSVLTADYLESLTRYADDGRSLLRAPQRYSSQQWRDNIGSITRCSILQAVRGQLVAQCLWALFVSLAYILARGAIPTLPALPHSLLGGVMGVLLGFRTNQSYDRFWEV
jgi:hypothetical protein